MVILHEAQEPGRGGRLWTASRPIPNSNQLACGRPLGLAIHNIKEDFMALVQVEVPYKKGYDFGIGVDLASGSPMGKAVGSPFSGVEKALGATTQFEVTRIHSTSD